MDNLYDISDVCELFGTTSRTLRFYEDNGTIQSTKNGNSARRKYTEDQLNNIRCVLVLRSIGISIKEIRDIQAGKTGISDAVRTKKAEIYATIERCRKKIILLNEALSILDSGGDVYEIDPDSLYLTPTEECAEIIEKCTEAILNGRIAEVFVYFSKELREKLDPDKFYRDFTELCIPLGKYVAPERMVYEKSKKSVVYHYIKYEKLGLMLKYVFTGNNIGGLWIDYYKI